MTLDAESGASTSKLLRTPLYDRHRALGARMVPFSSWEMPVQYSGILEEHRAVRERAGLFDVSHMGEFRVEGPGALDALQWLTPNNIARLADNQALYTQILRPDGGVIDDLLVYHVGDQQYMVVVNAGGIQTDWDWFTERIGQRDGVALTTVSDETALLALQGPLAQTILQPLTATSLQSIAYYHCQPGVVAGIDCLISRTGYTGEDGFELYCSATQAGDLWDALLTAGQPHGLIPAGLGARDTLRLESGYCLYGHELTLETTPLQAGLGWTVKLEKGADFIGRDALLAEKRDGLRRKLVGIELSERNVPRADYPLLSDGVVVGALTSGALSPTLGKGIGMGYVPPDKAAVGTPLAVEIRGKAIPAVVVPLPFYKRPTPQN